MNYRFHHLHVICRDLEGMIDFFTTVLDGRLLARQKFGTADGASIDLQGTTINLRMAREDEDIQGDASQTRYGFDHIGLQVDDLEAAIARSPEAGVAVDLARGDLRWRMAVPEAGALPWDGCFPALIEWEGAAHPAPRLPEAGCRLAALEVAHPEAAALAARLAPHLDDPRVTFAAGAPALSAVIETPGGARRLV